MKWKNIVISAVAGGVVFLVVALLADYISVLISPYSIMDIGGMRSMDDPVMALYFLYPFVFALTSAVVFDFVRDSIKGESTFHRGAMFGLFLFLLITIPEFFLLYSSMTYPVGFYISMFLTGIIAYPLMGMVYVKIWEKFV